MPKIAMLEPGTYNRPPGSPTRREIDETADSIREAHPDKRLNVEEFANGRVRLTLMSDAHPVAYASGDVPEDEQPA